MAAASLSASSSICAFGDDQRRRQAMVSPVTRTSRPSVERAAEDLIAARPGGRRRRQLDRADQPDVADVDDAGRLAERVDRVLPIGRARGRVRTGPRDGRCRAWRSAPPRPPDGPNRCSRGTARSPPPGRASARRGTWLRTATAPIGMATVGQALGHGEDVGRDARSRCAANGAPRRPKPVMTSSKMSRMPCSSQIARRRSR